MGSNEAYIKQVIENVKGGTEKGMRKAVIFAQGKAVGLAVDRIYSQPPTGNYVRTGLYKASIKGTITTNSGSKIEGVLESDLVYAKWLEYKCQKMCLTDAILNNQGEIVRLIKEEVLE